MTEDESFAAYAAKKLSKFESAAKLLRRHPELRPSYRTIQLIYQDGNSERALLRNLTGRSTKMVSNILKSITVGPEASNLFPWLNDIFLGQRFADGSVVKSELCGEITGRYMYCRPSIRGTVDRGGIIMLMQHEMSRFFHFFDFEKMEEVFEEASALGAITKYEHLQSNCDGSGFYFVLGTNLLILSLDPRAFRTSVGTLLQRDTLANDAVQLNVAGYTSNGTKFSSKAVMFHETNPSFGEKLSKAEVCIHLKVKKLSEAIMVWD